MNPFLLVAIILVPVILFILTLILFSKGYKATEKPINVSVTSSEFLPSCKSIQTICSTNDECNKKCKESSLGEQMKCQKIKDTGVCVPEIAELHCNAINGGVPAWSGWSGETQRMEWDCLCSYPKFFGGPGCDKLNPDVCKNGTFIWDKKENPEISKDCLCKCNDGFVCIKTPPGIPTCIKKDTKYWYNDVL